MSPRQRLERSSLPQLVADSILQDVERWVVRAGERLPPEAELASQFGVSRAVVREALKALQAQGLVEVRNGVGSVVVPVSSTPLARYFSFAARLQDVSLVELLEVRRGIEGETARLAAERATPADITELDRLVEEMARAMRSPETLTILDTAFHIAVARASRNQMLVYLTEAIRVPLRRSIESGLARWLRHGGVETVYRVHVDVRDAIRRADPGLARRAMDDHFDQALRIVRDSVADATDGRPSVASEVSEAAVVGSGAP